MPDPELQDSDLQLYADLERTFSRGPFLLTKGLDGHDLWSNPEGDISLSSMRGDKGSLSRLLYLGKVDQVESASPEKHYIIRSKK